MIPIRGRTQPASTGFLVFLTWKIHQMGCRSLEKNSQTNDDQVFLFVSCCEKLSSSQYAFRVKGANHLSQYTFRVKRANHLPQYTFRVKQANHLPSYTFRVKGTNHLPQHTFRVKGANHLPLYTFIVKGANYRRLNLNSISTKKAEQNF